MKNVLGIGTAACKLVNQLKQYPVYNCFFVSNEITKTSKYKFSLPTSPGPEEYEDIDMSKLHKWLEKIEKKVTIFLNGGSDSTGISLKMLENLYNRSVKMDIVYFMPEIEVLSEKKILHERSVRGILQNFARSGLFEKITLISNTELEKLAGSTNVFDYFDQINHVFTSSYYMLDVFKNTKPITSTFKIPKESCRISSIGLSTLAGEDKLFFPFKGEVEVVYYFGINEDKLRTEENLFRKITDIVKSKITKEKKVSFGIYPTKYDQDYVYIECYSPKIQQFVKEEDETENNSG